MQKETKITIDTYDKIARRYAKGHVLAKLLRSVGAKTAHDFYGPFLDRLRKGSKLLDVGCGAGRDTKYLMSKGYYVIGIDLSNGMLAEAKRRVPLGHFRRMDLMHLKLGRSSFDGIWCNASLLHIKKKFVPAVLRKFFEILKNGGILAVYVKNGHGERFKKYPDGTSRFFSFFSRPELISLLKRAGFKRIKARLIVEKDLDTWIQAVASKE